jgi:hypothetical protein
MGGGMGAGSVDGFLRQGARIPSVFRADRERKSPGMRKCDRVRTKKEADQTGELNPPRVGNHLIKVPIWNPT